VYQALIMKLLCRLEQLRAWHQRKMAEVAAVLPRGRTAAPFIAASVFASSCEGELALTMDLSVKPPADVNIQQVGTTLRGLEFQSSSGVQTLEFTEGDPVDFMNFSASAGSSSRLFTDEDLPEGTYTGVRLLFDEDRSENADFVVDGSGVQQELVITQGNYAEINLRVDEDEDSSDESLTLTLDLRQSLRFNDEENRYELTPVLQSVRTEDAGQISGAVSAGCSEPAAVYAFEGDVEPDDIGSSSTALYVTTSVSTFNAAYVLSFLPEGRYTLAVTCDATDEDPSTDDEIAFTSTTTVELEEAENLQQDL
jgi:hypothetical protein